jgi:fructose-1,6-bisphosphatase I
MRYVQCGAGLLAIAHKVIIPFVQIICAGYCDYGSATELVLTYGHGVERYTLDPSIGKCRRFSFLWYLLQWTHWKLRSVPRAGEFVMTGEKMMIPENPKTIYSINEGNYLTWDSPMQKCVDDFRTNKPAYTARYVGSMVADVHRTLMYGGIYMYPADAAKVRATLCLQLLFDVLLP